MVLNCLHWAVIIAIGFGWMVSQPLHLTLCLSTVFCWVVTGGCPLNPGETLGSFIGLPKSVVWALMAICIAANVLSWE